MLLAATPVVTLRGLKLSVIMTYLVLAVMTCLPIGAGAVILAQTTPTMYEHRPAPRSRSTISSGSGEGNSGNSLSELRRDYDTTIPMLVSDVERLARDRAADAAYINEARTNLATMALKVDRLESYATYLMAAVSALVIGMVLQIYTKMQERRRGREEDSRD